MGMWIFIFLGAVLGIILFLLKCIRRIPAREIWIVDHLGKIVAKEPGYTILIEHFGIDRVIAKLPWRVSFSVKLFEDVEEIRIDLREGGEVILKDPRIWITLVEPRKAFEISEKPLQQLREIAEHRLTGGINNMTHDELTLSRVPSIMRPGREILQRKLDEILRSSREFMDFVKTIGAEFNGFTLDDFDFDPETLRQRRERILSAMNITIAENRSKATLNEVSAVGAITQMLKQSGFDPKSAGKTATRLFENSQVLEKGGTVIIWRGGGQVIGGIVPTFPVKKEKNYPLGGKGRHY